MTLSIIIPTLNEVDYLKDTLSHLLKVANIPTLLEIHVVDAGSTDGTLESIASIQCKTYTQPDFALKKYQSLNYGLDSSHAEVVLFLDADTLLPDKFDQLIAKALLDPRVVGGAFEFDFTETNFSLWIIKMINRIRYRVERSYFGDQAVFCRKSIALKIGGMPKKPLMESAYFCQGLRREGKLRLIKHPVKTSPRRFLQHGIWKVMWFDFRMWIRFVLQIDVDKFGRNYWKGKH